MEYGVLPPVIALLKLPAPNIGKSAAELLAKIAEVKEYQVQISANDTLPQLVDLLNTASPAAQLAGLNALNELLFENIPNQARAQA